MRSIPVILAVSVVMLLSGCAQTTPEDDWDSDTYEEASSIYFSPYSELPDAAVGVPYNYSFCNPAPTNLNDLCGALEDSIDPSGGNHPYHFTLGSGVGFQQFGLLLNLNGLLAGTPTAAGTKTFNVCAVDLSGNQQCDNFTLTVIPSYTLAVHSTGSGSGTTTVKSTVDYEEKKINCTGDCTLSFPEGTSVTLTFTPDDGSTLDGLSGDCNEEDMNYGCGITMDKDKSVTVNFDKLGLEITSSTCSYNTEVGYNYLVVIQGTATGPKGTSVSLDISGAQGSAFYDIGYDCGTWGGGGMFGCGNSGAYSTSSWSQSYKIYSLNPFTYTPTVTLKADNGAPIVVQPSMYCQ